MESVSITYVLAKEESHYLQDAVYIPSKFSKIYTLCSFLHIVTMNSH